MSVADLVPRVREALGVSSSYDAETIPAAIRRSISKLLRDYNFPKSLFRKVYENVGADVTTLGQPVGMKKPNALFIYDPASGLWSDEIVRSTDGWGIDARGWKGSEGPDSYWLQGTDIVLDRPLGTAGAGMSLYLYYQSMSVEANESWITEDFEDVIFTLTVYRLAADVRKPEVSTAYGPLWAEDQRSLAIYANELEFDGLVMLQRMARPVVNGCCYYSGGSEMVGGLQGVNALSFGFSNLNIGDVLDGIVLPKDYSFEANFAGSFALCIGDFPAANEVVQIREYPANGGAFEILGTITVAPDGSITLATTGGGPKTAAAGNVVTVSALTSNGASGVSVTLMGKQL